MEAVKITVTEFRFPYELFVDIFSLIQEVYTK